MCTSVCVCVCVCVWAQRVAVCVCVCVHGTGSCQDSNGPIVHVAACVAFWSHDAETHTPIHARTWQLARAKVAQDEEAALSGRQLRRLRLRLRRAGQCQQQQSDDRADAGQRHLLPEAHARPCVRVCVWKEEEVTAHQR